MRQERYGKPAHLATLGQWWHSLRWVALTLSLMLVVALAGSFVPYESVIANGHPWLPQKTCTGCAFCGMTRSFCAMSAGRWGDAADWNPLGPLCYSLSWLWVATCFVLIGKTAYDRVKLKSELLALHEDNLSIQHKSP